MTHWIKFIETLKVIIGIMSTAHELGVNTKVAEMLLQILRSDLV